MDASEVAEATVNTETKKYKLTLEGGGIKVDREVDEATALQVVAIAMGASEFASRAAAAATSKGGAPASGGTAAGRVGLSIREYLNEVEAKRNLDKIVAIGAYLESERGLDGFGSAQIRKEFRSARESVPGNLPRDIAAAVASGWLAASPDDPNEYYVTDSGHKAIEAKFSQEMKNAASSRRASKRRKPKADPEPDGNS